MSSAESPRVDSSPMVMSSSSVRAMDEGGAPSVRPLPRMPSSTTVTFVGSSIVREWRERRDFAEDWRGRLGLGADGRALNRGFGGAETTDLLTFFDDVVNFERYGDVRAIVYYCGSNDVSVGRSAREVFENFKRFAERARRARARVGVVFVGVIDSPQKKAFGLSDVVRETNALCEAWCASTPGATYADVTETFADASAFREDGTHLRTEAYDGLRDAIARAIVPAVTHASSARDDDDDDAFFPPSMRR